MISSDYIHPRIRAKIDRLHPIANISKLPTATSWAEFAALTEIRSGDGIVRFNPFEYQCKLVNAIERNKLTVVGKSRQLGISETICNYFLYKACIDRSVLAVILSLGQRETIDLARRVRFAIESLSPYGLTTSTDTLTDIQINGGGRLLFRPSNENSTRGLPAVTHALLDEAGFVDNIDRIYQAIIPATSTVTNPKIVVVSTPNGSQGWFYNLLATDGLIELCEGMRSGEIASYQEIDNKVLIHWKSHPKFSQQSNYLETIANETGLSETVIAQEYDLSFDDKDEAVFSAAIVRGAATLETMSKEYKPEHWYYIGVDGSTVGDDYTVAMVIEYDLTSNFYSVVDMYRKRKGSIEADVYQISALVDKYQPRVLAIESNGVGQIFVEQLAATHPIVKTTGVHTSQDSKASMIERLSLALERQVLSIPKTSPIVNELLSFRRVGKRLEASPGSHDDTVMAIAVALSQTEFRIHKPTLNIGNISTF